MEKTRHLMKAIQHLLVKDEISALDGVLCEWINIHTYSLNSDFLNILKEISWMLA